ncbi:MAG: hypothetical protein HY064_06600 [Bacteroidetes bacterium]|nr:hypothetical protein [Bacteroidota bacterium]
MKFPQEKYLSVCPMEESDLHRLGLKGKIISIREIEYITFDTGQLARRNYNGDITDDRITYYDSLGYETGGREFEKTGLIKSESKITRNERMYKTEDKKTDVKGRILDLWTSVYDDSCRLGMQKEFGPGNILLKSYARLYPDSNKIFDTEFDSKGNITGVSVYEYDTPHLKSDTKIYDSKMKITDSAYFIGSNDKRTDRGYFYYVDSTRNFTLFDSTNVRGDEVVKNFYHSNGTLEYGYVYVYVYDTRGNWIKKTEIRNVDKSVFVTRRIIVYGE